MINAKPAGAILLILLLIPIVCLAASIQEILEGMVLSPSGYTAEISGQIQACMPYGEDRLKNLNQLIRHMKLRIGKNGSFSSVALIADGHEALKVTEQETSDGWQIDFSFDSERSWFSDSSFFTAESLLAGFPKGEETNLKVLTRKPSPGWLQLTDDAAALVRVLPDLFPEQTKTTAVKTKIRDLGIARQKIVITFTKAEMEENALKILAEKTENNFLKSIFEKAAFTGRQQFTLFLNDQGELMRLLFTGQAGWNEDLRKVTLEWNMIRDAEREWDILSLKLPAVTGNNRDFLKVEREAYPKGEQDASLRLEVNWQRTLNKVKNTLEGKLQLKLDPTGTLTGQAECSFETGKNSRETIQIEPTVHWQDAADWEGQIRFVTLKNEKVQFDIDLETRVSAGAEESFPKNLPVEKLAEGRLTKDLERKMTSAIIQALILLPREDLGFFLDELDTESLEQIRQTAVPSSVGGTTP